MEHTAEAAVELATLFIQNDLEFRFAGDGRLILPYEKLSTVRDLVRAHALQNVVTQTDWFALKADEAQVHVFPADSRYEDENIVCQIRMLNDGD